MACRPSSWSPNPIGLSQFATSVAPGARPSKLCATSVVVEPASILDDSRRGANDLYVALSRTTNRLGLLHSRGLPPALASARAVTSIDAIG